MVDDTPVTFVSDRPKIISGGQTGVDRGALDAAMAMCLPVGGYCPAGRRAEDGPIPSRYHLTQLASPHYAHRTVANIKEADATLIFMRGERMTRGTALTYERVTELKKPHRVYRLDGWNWNEHHQNLVEWLRLRQLEVINVAGPRESSCPGIQAQTTAVLYRALYDLLYARFNKKERL